MVNSLDLKGLPKNLEAERLILGSILTDSDIYPGAAGALKSADFSLEANRRIFGRMGEMFGRGERIDRVTLANELMRHAGELEAIGGMGYMCSLDDGLPQIYNLDSYLRIVKDKAILRQIIVSSQSVIDRCVDEQDAPQSVIQDASSALLGMAPDDPDEPQTPWEIIQEVGMDALSGAARGGIETGVHGIDDLIVGLQKEDLILLAARPSVGKTAMALQIAMRAATAGHGVLVCSLEMGKVSLTTRIVCGVATVDSQLLRLGTLTAPDRGRVMDAVAAMKELPLWIDKSARTVAAIHSKLRKAMVGHKIGLLVIDYIQLMESSGRSENRNQEITKISQGLKHIAEDFHIPVLALSQLNRPMKGTNPEPLLPDLRDSGSLEQDADVVLFLHRPNGLADGSAKMILAKQRNGPVGSVMLTFVGRYGRFAAISHAEDR